ncbi:protein phosphatase 2C domain-containing protein [Pendulispora brunnea]|uniref:Protein phosphatase 2C domain-containing protein n=1 Tax=Pendulispora brunnea TaxID=2905690 RepID=A0ABZ2KCS6_9BACT
MIRPRHLVHRGSVPASGFVLDTRLVPEATARARILSIAASVMEVRRADDRLIVRLRRPVRLDAATAIGAPLVSYGRLHAAMALDPDEVQSLATGSESVVLAAGGECVSLPLAGIALEDIAQWLDVSSFDVRTDAVSLGEIAMSPAAQWVPPSEDVRAPLGVEPMAKAGEALLAALASPPGAAPPPRPWLSMIWRAFAWLMTWRAPASSSSDGTAPPASPSWFERVRGWFEGVAARLLFWTRLAPLVGRRHAQYLERLFDMFAADDLEGALRHAIPLNDSVAGALKTRPLLATPSPRSNLAIVPARGLATATMQLGDNLFDTLRQTYRRAFDALVQRGDIEKAAFVLAELLQSNLEAVSFLERHGRWTLAAEIAEARKLTPALVVRQWFLAGNKERAIRVARRTGTFAEAVSRLESSHAQEAYALRLAWADMLASSGAYAAAVDVVWLIPAARGLAGEWIERAIAVGGITGAKMLVRKLHMDAGAFSEVRDLLASRMAMEGEGAAVATAVGQAVLSEEKREDMAILAKLAARALMPHAHASPALVQQLVERAADPVFSADARPRGPARESAVRLKAFALTHMGTTRMSNEDACIATTLTRIGQPRSGTLLDVDVAHDGVLIGAFDGTGGHASGELASALAASIIADALQRAFAKNLLTVEVASRALTAAVECANRAIFKRATEDRSVRGSGSEATVATVQGSTLLVAQVGATRAYLLREGELLQLTKDHSLLNDYLAKQTLTPEQVAGIPGNVITRALGMKEDVSPDIVRIDLRRDDTVLLCSDGLWQNLEGRVIQSILQGRSPQAAAEELVHAVLSAGAPDNISVVVAQIAGDVLPAKSLSEHRVAGDAGAIPIYDAVALPDGRLLVALGEVGVWLLSREGKVLTRFGEPAHQLVISDHGDRAILVAPRGETWRLARLDILARKVRPWCDARIDHFADTFDGAVWYVSRGDTLFAIDVLCTDWEHLWEVHDPDFSIRSIGRSPQSVSAYFQRRTDLHDEIWTFEAKTHTLRQRAPVNPPSALFRFDAAGPGGACAGWFKVDNGDEWESYVYNRKEWIRIPLSSALPEPSSASHEHAAFAHWGNDGLSIRIYDIMAKEWAAFRLDGDRGAHIFRSRHVRFQEDCTLVFDPWGRILILQSGRITREYRI